MFPDHTKLSPTFSCKFNLCSAVAVNHTLRLLKHVKNPGMVSSSDTQHVPRQSSLPRRCYPSIAWMRHTSEMTYASHGVPMKASANHRGQNLAITIAQCQRTWSVQRSHKTAVVIDIGRFGNEHGSACGKLRRNRTTFEHTFVRIEQELGAQSSSTSVEALQNPIGNCVETEHRLLGTPGAKTKSAFRQSVVFFLQGRLRTAASRSAIPSRVRLVIIWLSP